jgi:copper(I)-binding protein
MRTLLATILIVMPFAEEAGIQVDHVWARAAPAGHEGAVYLTITDGGAPDTLTGVTTPVAAEAALHQSTTIMA